MEIWKDEKYLCFLSCVFAMEDKKVEWEKININFICFVKKNKTMENVIWKVYREIFYLSRILS